MIRRIILLSLLLVVFSRGFSRTNNDWLERICKVWGFLKYHDPEVAKGKLNWDSALIVSLNRLEIAKTDKEAESVVKALILMPGNTAVSSVEKPSNPGKDTLVSFIDWKWMDRFADASIVSLLKKIRYDKKPLENAYVTDMQYGQKLGYAIFSEKKYNDPLPNKNYRLLSLFRFWNIIHYFFPYYNLMDEHWDKVLKNYIPKFMHTEDTLSYHLMCYEIATKLCDGHGAASSKLVDGMNRLRSPFRLRYVEGQYVVSELKYDSLLRTPPLEIGDILLAIDGVPVKQKELSLRKYYGGSNQAGIKGISISSVMIGSNKENSLLTILRGNKKMNVNVSNSSAASQKNMYAPVNRFFVNDSIAYLNMPRITSKDSLPVIFNNYRQVKSLILDLRGYPDFRVFREFLSYVNTENIPYAYFLSAVVSKPGYFSYNQEGFDFVSPKKDPFGGKIIVLVDERTMSLAEFFTMALQVRPNTIVMGSQTWGADGDRVLVDIPGAINIGFSSLGVFYPDKSICQRKGIKIDIPVKRTIKGVSQNRDEILERAIALLKK
jgi:carboxyl-terminal processing protease